VPLPLSGRRTGRLLGTVLATVLGAATTVAAVAVHGRWWGLLLALAATAAALAALPPGSPRFGYAVGWAAMLGYLLVPRGEGDYVVAQDTGGYVLLVTALVVVVAAIVTLPRPGMPGPHPTAT
jgi:hypothetical protein